MITPADLLAPVGPVEATLFPGEGDGSAGTALELRLTEYISQAYEKISEIALAEPEDAAKAWSLHLTFNAAYLLACIKPSTDNSLVQGIGSETFSKDQRDALKALADKYAREFFSSAIEPDSQPTSPQSRTTTINYAW